MKQHTLLTAENMNQNLLGIQYAVRGPLTQRAEDIETELAKGVRKPFSRVIRANIADCHALGQKPITFIRQVLALVMRPELLDDTSGVIPRDVQHRARLLLDDCKRGSVGAYSPAAGLGTVRRAVASYISQRDHPVPPTSPQDVLLTAGAADGVRALLTLLAAPVNGKPPAVMIPVPQYPLFSGLLAEVGVAAASYYLAEEAGWALRRPELERAWREAAVTHAVRALVVISPGNPTGQVLGREEMEEVVRFVYERGLLLLADEVYQENVITKPFISFRKVALEMGEPYCSVQLASVGSCSKGWAAESGVRGGWLELLHCEPRVHSALLSSRALLQCPPVLGQCALHCVMQPPIPGDPSYAQFREEVDIIQHKIRDRAAFAHAAFNAIPGYSCNPIEGSVCAFPRVEIPPRAQEAAREQGLEPDEFYCLRLLEETGVCVVPGSGFGQRPGTHHFRTTVAHSGAELQHMLASFASFHANFRKQYT